MKLLNQIFKRVPRWVLSGVVLTVVCILTLYPFGPSHAPRFPYADKVVHFLMFGALAVALMLDIYRRRAAAGCHWLVAAVIAAVIGGVIEILQDAMGLGRSGDWFDLVADSAGALVVAATMCVIMKKTD